jgi:predicted DNA-binding protein
MGRPPLNLQATQVRLSRESLRRIEAVAGKNQMAAFIREAVEAELLRREDLKRRKVKSK